MSEWRMTLQHVMMSCMFMMSVVHVGGVNGGHALHTSSYQIQQLWQAEEETIQQVHDVLQSLEEINNVLKRYMMSWETIAHAKEESSDAVDAAGPGDPAATYALLRHVSEGWKEVDETLTKAKHLFIKIEYLAARPDREPLPNNDDVAGASEALAKLAHVYHFNTSALARGFLQGTLKAEEDALNTSSLYLHSLTVSDLASIGLAAVNKGYFNVGVDFLRAARLRASSTHPTRAPDHESQEMMSGSHFSPQRVESLLNTAVKVHNHVLDIRGSRSLTHTTATFPYSSLGRLVQEKTLQEEDLADEREEEVILGGDYLKRHDNKTWMLSHRPLVEQQQIEMLCRGQDLRPVHMKSTLSCSYLRGTSPWLLLAPFKVEVVSLDPHIAIIYEIITSQESAEVKAAAHRDLQTPYHELANRRENGSQTEWSLKHVWLESQSLTALQRLSRRLAHVAQVDLGDNTSEPFMVANYGLGGDYGAHRDTHGPSKRPPNHTIGERLATVVTYLQAPRSGGRLVFPWVGAGVDAVEGAAVVWWNLLASHEHDFLTRHAACPILRGHKWIANKWVGYNGQWNAQPCPINPSRKIALGLPFVPVS